MPQTVFNSRAPWPAIFSALCWLAASALTARAEPWPTASHDNRRTGVTEEHLAPPLALQWIFRSPSPPAQGWPPPVNDYGARKNKSEASYDDAFRVIAADGTVYFCSSAENALYAIDAASGKVRWTWIGDAAPRLAPALHDNRLYFGADDGKVRCLRADDGQVCWEYDATIAPEKMLGYGRFSSVWPIRTGVIIEDGKAYFVSGLFPSEGIFFHALDPKDGTLLWRRQIDLEISMGLPPQGDLLATRDSLLMTSRAMPTRWDKSDGRPIPFFTPHPDVANAHEYRFYNAGTDARIWQDRYFVYGSGCILAYDPDKVRLDKHGRKQPGELIFNWFNARQAVFAEPMAYLTTDYHVLAVEQSQLPELADAECYEFEKLYKRLRISSRLDWMEEYARTVADLGAEHPRSRWIKDGPLKWSQSAWEQWPRLSKEVFGKIARKSKWMTPLEANEALILAGRVLYAGGNDAVHAIDTADGRVLWGDKTGSRVRGLAVSDGRLLVSTIDGCIRCYGRGEGPGPATEVLRAAAETPVSHEPLPEPCREVVEKVAAAWRDQPGYCLVLGGGDGRLAAELARRTRLNVQILDTDLEQVIQTRGRLLAAGLYGWRTGVGVGDLVQLPYPPYLFNVVIDQKGLSQGSSPTPPSESIRVARPLGGTVYLGRTSSSSSQSPRPSVVRPGPQPASHATMSNFSPKIADEDSGATVTAEGGVARIVRGKLLGTADWGHNYATSANTYCNEDQRVKGPFGILWYGEPGPRERIDRHATPPIPLVVDGIMFTVGRDRLMAFDAYNGIKHWDRVIPGVARSGLPMATSNMAAHGRCLYVIVADRECWQIDARTGKTLRVYPAPKREGAEHNFWAWIATDGALLYGSRATVERKRADLKHSDELFAIAIATGQECWRKPIGCVEHDGIALAGGRLFYVDRNLNDEEKQQAAGTPPADTSVPDRPAEQRKGRAMVPDLRKLVALEAGSGKLLWQKPFNATDITLDDNVVCAGRVGVACMSKDGVVIVHGTGSLGHPHREFLRGEFARRGLYAFAGDSGKYLWGGRKGYRKRPILVGRHVYAEPFAWDFKTGEPLSIANPLSGQPQLLDFHRGYIGCSHLLASGGALFGNKPGIAYWNIDSCEGFVPFESMVFGCGICATPACGVFVAPEGRSGCTCPVGIHTSLALYPRRSPRAWGIGFAGGIAPVASLPVRHMAINLGAPGWREDQRKRLWIPYPGQGGGLVGAWLPSYKHTAQQFYAESPELVKIAGTDTPWLFTSGCRAETDLQFRLVGQGDAPGRFTVRLYFAEPELLRAGQRVFDVLIQGKKVLTDFDIAGEAGGARRALIKEYPEVPVEGELTIGLRRSNSTPQQAPILCAVEALRAE